MVMMILVPSHNQTLQKEAKKMKASILCPEVVRIQEDTLPSIHIIRRQVRDRRPLGAKPVVSSQVHTRHPVVDVIQVVPKC